LLADLYEALGGVIVRRRLTRTEFADLPGLPVNCAGYGARDLVDDSVHAERGHLVHVSTDRYLTDGERPFSYSYEASALDGPVYAFPRADALVLGGSRIEATPEVGSDPGGVDGETVTVDGVEVPAHVVATNREILSGFGFDIDASEWDALEGWRPVREDGLRVETGAVDGRTVVHNYGHAGSGVTLSWGSARQAAGLVAEVLGERDPEPVSPGRRFAIARHLQRYVREH
jgi:D-amino-acid oxidase